MNTKEKIFRVFSLAFLGVGFIAGVASADKEGSDQTVATLEQMIHDIKQTEQVQQINSGKWTQQLADSDDQEIVLLQESPKVKSAAKKKN